MYSLEFPCLVPIPGDNSMNMPHSIGACTYACTKSICRIVDVRRQEDGNNDHESDREPCHNWGICFRVIYTIHLFSPMHVQSGLVNRDLICREIAFAAYAGPLLS